VTVYVISHHTITEQAIISTDCTTVLTLMTSEINLN